MLKALFKRYKHYRKEKYFRSPLFGARKQYAFVGFGIHSMTSFYPVLRHFNIPLKYVVTKDSQWQNSLSPLFPGCTFTHNLEAILTDDTIAGVFVCASPEAHYDILTPLLKAGKSVFVEKPPCQTLAQLRHLQQLNPAAICKVGLQRRYWPGNRHITDKCRRASTYLYQFQTGSYPQGDVLTELFIHPLDYARFLFGEPRLRSLSKHEDRKGITLQLHLTHPGNISGLLHLSTHHTWNPPVECLMVQTPGESLTIQYPGSVSGKQMPLRVLDIPTERLVHSPVQTKEYFSGNPTLVPDAHTNTFLIQGFLPEITRFITLVEAGDGSAAERNDLASLSGIYELMQNLAQPDASA
jgi:virulence factor